MPVYSLVSYQAIIGLEPTTVTAYFFACPGLALQQESEDNIYQVAGRAKPRDDERQPGVCRGDLVILWTLVGSQSDSLRQIQSKWSGRDNNDGREEGTGGFAEGREPLSPSIIYSRVPGRKGLPWQQACLTLTSLRASPSYPAPLSHFSLSPSLLSS